MKLALKLRPKSLNEMIGQTHIKQQLEKMGFPETTESNLFIISGMTGVGKTTLARIMSTMLDGQIIELNAVTQAGVEDIRQLETLVAQRPVGYSTTCIILDEAHNLQKRASESLLKLLEELPDYVYVFMPTTSPQSILDTIKARAYSLNLKPVDSATILNYLERVVSQEKMKVPYDILQKISKKCEGSVRNSLKLLTEYDLSGRLDEIPKEILEDILNGKSIDDNLQRLVNLGYESMDIMSELIMLAYSTSQYQKVSYYMIVLEKLAVAQQYREKLFLPIFKEVLENG